MGEQISSIINLVGGLDLVSTHYTIQAAPGSARRMVNYEPSVQAGYRRINGYTKFGSTQPNATADPILGTYPYSDGVIAIQGTGVYFSTDGITWSQLNRDTYVAQTGTVQVTGGSLDNVNGTGTSFLSEFAVGDSIRIDGVIREVESITSDLLLVVGTEFPAAISGGTAIYKQGTDTLTGTVLPRTDAGRAMFAWYPSDGDYGSLVVSDERGINDLCRFKINGSGVSRTYEYDVLTETDFAGPQKPKYVTQFKEHVVAFNDDTNSGNITWSDSLSNKRFDGASAGVAQLESPIVAGKGLRDKLIVFTRNSIYQLVNIDDVTNLALLPVTSRTGCASGWSVQEFAGDLVFLSWDGIRTITTSEQYGDVKFGVISSAIDPIIKNLLNNIQTFDISSTMLRFKSQYRLFYTKSTFNADQQLAISGTWRQNAQGEQAWHWSTLQGIPLSCVEGTNNNYLDLDSIELHYQGGYDGYVYAHDSGNDFNGGNIQATLELNELDYGDIGRRKTLHYVRVFGDIEEGSIDDIDMNIKYDFESGNTAQPRTYTITTATEVSKYGTARFGFATYGGNQDFSNRVLVEGSGYSNKFIFSSDGIGDPYNINSIYVDMRVGPLQ